jgi:carboxyl-terminal processing protease
LKTAAANALRHRHRVAGESVFHSESTANPRLFCGSSNPLRRRPAQFRLMLHDAAQPDDDHVTSEARVTMTFLLRLRFAVPLVLIALLLACGESSSPTSATPPSARQMSPLARSHLTHLLDIMQANSINRHTIDWPAFRQTVEGVMPNAQTIKDLYPRIRTALLLLNDHHSFYQGPDSTYIYSPSLGPCTDPTPPAVQVSDDIGYIKVGSFTGRGSAETAFAQSIQDAVRAADRGNLAGWIVDLRNNGGGNMWPMIAGLGPILGEGTAGAFVDPDGGITWWGYQDNASIYNESPFVRVPTPYRLLRANPRVAVLTNCGVKSSGEAVAIAFRARRNTRSFGTATYGLSTANEEFALTGGGTLVLCVSTMADRTGRTYGNAVASDEVIGDPVETVHRAIEWLRR